MTLLPKFGPFDQLKSITFPQHMDICAIQYGCSRPVGDTFGTLPDGYVISPASIEGTSSFVAGFTGLNKLFTSGVVPSTSGLLTESNPNLVFGYSPLPTMNDLQSFTGASVTNALGWTTGPGSEQGGTGGVLPYAERGYVFLNLTKIKNLGYSTVSFDIGMDATTWSTYNLWVENFVKIRSMGFGTPNTLNHGSNGDTVMTKALTMGWNSANMVYHCKGIGTPSLSGTKAEMTPTVTVQISAIQSRGYTTTMSGSGFASNNAFSSVGGTGSD